MELILQIIGFGALAHLIVDMIVHFNAPLPEKPFKCEMCMGYWLAIIPFMYQFGLVGILYAAISGVCANLMYKYI